MKNTIFTTVLLVALTLSSFAQKHNTLTAEEFACGWELLFDGETTNGWKGFNSDTPKTWEVADGMLLCTGESGGTDIITVKQYRDFDFKFEWKIESNGNSGVIWHAREGKQWGAPYLTGPEFQVHDETNKFDKNSTGSCYDVFEPSKDKKVNPAMEWNSGRIRVSNGQVTYWVNGVITVNYQLFSTEWETKVAASKWKNNPYYGRSPFGGIDFQNHGSKVWYRNIKVKELN